MDHVSAAAALVGSRAELAKLMGVSAGAVSKWSKQKKIPINRVIRFEQITGISRHVLRPDIFGEAQ
jgi:DNA-binding transcriptional regulator YdaS (Cro superfamily)